jgi:hypothetical protein
MKHFLRNGYRSESQAIFAAFSVAPTAQRRYAIDRAVRSLIAAGIWAKLDALYVLAAADSQAARINWIAPRTFTATNVNTATFTQDRGFTGNGTTSYIDSTFDLASATSPKYTQNSASYFGRSLTNAQSNSGFIGTGGASATLFNNRLVARNTSDLFLCRVNGNGAQTSVANTNSTGFYAGNRTTSSDIQCYKDGSSVGTQTATSQTPDTGTFCAGRAGSTTFNDYQIASFGFGQSLSAAEHASLAAADLAYMTAVGAV